VTAETRAALADLQTRMADAQALEDELSALVADVRNATKAANDAYGACT